MILRRFALGTLTLLALSSQMAPSRAAEVTPPTLDADATIVPETTPYPEATLARRQVHEALQTALKTHRRVMLVFGGNWCPDCRYLAGVFEQPDVAKWLDAHFVVVPINIGRLDYNLDIAAQYGVKIQEVPTVLLISNENKVLNADSANVLGDARDLSPQNIIDQIVKWNAH